MRTYKRKTERAMVSKELIAKAISMVKEKNQKVAEVARALSIPRRSLTRYLSTKAETPSVGYTSSRQVCSKVFYFNLYK